MTSAASLPTAKSTTHRIAPRRRRLPDVAAAVVTGILFLSACVAWASTHHIAVGPSRTQAVTLSDVEDALDGPTRLDPSGSVVLRRSRSLWWATAETLDVTLASPGVDRRLAPVRVAADLAFPIPGGGTLTTTCSQKLGTALDAAGRGMAHLTCPTVSEALPTTVTVRPATGS